MNVNERLAINQEFWTPTQESEKTHMRQSDIYSYWSQNTQNNTNLHDRNMHADLHGLHDCHKGKEDCLH